MQPIRQLSAALAELASGQRCLFTPADLCAVVPGLSQAAFKTLLSRAARGGVLQRLCRGLYLYPCPDLPRGEVLLHAAARLRADSFNYLSLETVLSDAGVISQVPINWVTLMSAGRSTTLQCGDWGTIEFVHTRKQPKDLVGQLVYDSRCRLWRATAVQALRDLRVTRRSRDLVDWSLVHDLV